MSNHHIYKNGHTMYFTHFNNDDNVHDNVAEAAIIPGS